MEHKVSVKKQATLGGNTVTLDLYRSLYGITVSGPTWQVDTYEFADEGIAESVFNLVVAILAELIM